MTPHTIYFVRHGQTVGNVERRLQGQWNTPLTPLGIAQARRNAETLLEAVPNVRALPFVSSPLGRARQTMEVLREQIGLPLQGYLLDKRLAELCYGAWQGLLMSEVQSRFRDEWARRQTPATKWTHVPPEGESYQQLSERLMSWLADISGDTVLVGHACVGRVLRGLNLGRQSHEIAFSEEPEHDRVYRLARGTEAVF